MGGGECVAPWQLEAVHPVRGHVIVPDVVLTPVGPFAVVELPLPEPLDVVELTAVLLVAEPFAAWQVAAVQPVAGQT